MLLNKVVVGKGYKMTQDSTSLSAPPAGYDSVSSFTVLVLFKNVTDHYGRYWPKSGEALTTMSWLFIATRLSGRRSL
jgi:hypothetical protein